jgi:hypothetical protein
MSDRDFEYIESNLESETECSIDMNTAQEEALWYSVANVLALSQGSGMGIPSDKKRESKSGAEVPLLENPAPLKAIFKNGDPHLTQPFQQHDLSTWRWSESSFDRQLTPQAQGWTIIAEAECAKWFSLTENTESLPMDLRREWLKNSLLLWNSAREQCDFAFDSLRNDQGLFALAAEPGSVIITDSGANLEDQACMLWAVCDVAGIARRVGSLLQDKDELQVSLERADELFHIIVKDHESLLDASVNKVQARAVAVSALIWYANVTENEDLQAGALRLMRAFADDLVKAQDKNEAVGETLIDAACALCALVDAFRITRLKTYAECAAKVTDFIESQWSKTPGFYFQTPLAKEITYNVDDVGTILGALNRSRLFLKGRVNRELLDLRIRGFFGDVVNKSGLQMSMPSIDFLPNWLRQREPSVHFRNDSVPLPSEAGGSYGIAPVFAGEIGYDLQSDTWSREMTFEAQAAMRACCEFIWLNHDIVNGFPEIDFEQSPTWVREAAGVAPRDIYRGE